MLCLITNLSYGKIGENQKTKKKENEDLPEFLSQA
jgi:hypothetical protein